MIQTVTLKDLVGKHMLDGVDFYNQRFEHEYYNDQHSSVCRFRLDGKIYKAVEDPSDGYRSSMDSIFIDPSDKMENEFPPIHVIGEMKEAITEDFGYTRSCDILLLKDAATGLVVLEVGTDNTDDYYPYFVSNFRPENMAINQLLGENVVGGERHVNNDF